VYIIQIDENIRDLLIRTSSSFKNLREAHDNTKTIEKFHETELRRRIGLIMDYQDKYNILKEYYEKEILLKEKNIVIYINIEFLYGKKRTG
jgi:hypothetical protein